MSAHLMSTLRALVAFCSRLLTLHKNVFRGETIHPDRAAEIHAARWFGIQIYKNICDKLASCKIAAFPDLNH
eukprot:5127116-Pyramimonas_sp.AAC.1